MHIVFLLQICATPQDGGRCANTIEETTVIKVLILKKVNK